MMMTIDGLNFFSASNIVLQMTRSSFSNFPLSWLRIKQNVVTHCNYLLLTMKTENIPSRFHFHHNKSCGIRDPPLFDVYWIR